MRGWCEMSVGYARSYTTLKLLNDDHLTTTTKQKFTTLIHTPNSKLEYIVRDLLFLLVNFITHNCD